MNTPMHKIFCVAIFMSFVTILSAQEESSLVTINENTLMETYWRYTGTENATTGEVIHNASEDYDYFLNLKFDYTYREYLNGKIDKGTWLLNDQTNELYYNFRNIKWWLIKEVSNDKLVLEFSIGGESFFYNFQNVEPENTPFLRPANELPRVKVNKKRVAKRSEKKEDKKALKKAKRTEKLQAKLVKKRGETADQVPIEIQMVGGGFYGGLDPVLKDYVVIKNNGKLIREFQSLQKGLIKTTKELDRLELESIADFILSKNFFEFEKTYDCTDGDCMKRKKEKPIPIPLRISVKYGNQYNVVTIMVYGKDDKRRGKYVDYPQELDMIIDGIRKLSDVNL